LLKISRVILVVIVFLIAGYGLISRNFEIKPYMWFFIALMMLVIGIETIQKRQGYGWLNIVLSLYILFLSLNRIF
jgi:hypothetical protein